MKQWEIRQAVVGEAMTTATRDATPSLEVPYAHLEQLPITSWTTDPVLTLTSSGGGEIDGFTLDPDRFVGRTLFDLFDTDDPRLPVIEAHVRAVAGERVSFAMRLADRVFHGRVSPLRDREGKQIGTICAVIEDASADLAIVETASTLVAVE